MLQSDPYMLGSGITNSALLNLTKTLSSEFGPDRVSAVCPGWVDTELWRRNAAELVGASEDQARRVAGV